MAKTDLSGGVTVGGQHDSNPLELSKDNVRLFKENGWIAQEDDTARRLTANLNAAAGVINGPIYLRLTSQYTQINWVHMDGLNHTDYNVGGHLDWRPSQLFDVSLDVSQTRAPVSLNDVGGTVTVQQTSQHADGTLRLRPTPNWQLSLAPGWYDYKLPLPGSDNFELRVSSGTARIDYLGGGRLIPGVVVKESNGRYSQVHNATRYQQRSAGFSLNYEVTDFSSFSLFTGYSQNETHLLEPSTDPLALSLEGTSGGFAGRLSYQRQLSVKTSLSVGAYRDFQQYDVGVNTMVGTGFDGGITWKPTAKLSAALDAGIVWLKINGLQIARSLDERKDLERSGSLSLRYAATQRVSLRTYLTRRLHNSTVRTGVFDKTIAGLELSATFD